MKARLPGIVFSQKFDNKLGPTMSHDSDMDYSDNENEFEDYYSPGELDIAQNCHSDSI